MNNLNGLRDVYLIFVNCQLMILLFSDKKTINLIAPNINACTKCVSYLNKLWNTSAMNIWIQLVLMQ